MNNLVTQTTIENAIQAILEPYSSFPNDEGVAEEEAWKRYFNAYKIIRDKLSFFFATLSPAAPVPVNNLNISRSFMIVNWESFKNTIKNGIAAPTVHNEIVNIIEEEVDNMEQGAKNFYQFWLRFFYLCLNFETMNYSDGSNTAVCMPASSAGDISTSPVSFNVSYTATVIRNILDQIIKIENNIVKIKYLDSLRTECQAPGSLSNGYFSLQDFTPESCYFKIIIKSMMKNFFSNENFSLFIVKITSLVQAGNPVYPTQPTNTGAPALLGIAA